MAVILLQALMALSVLIRLIVIGSFLLIPFVTIIWSEVVIHKRKIKNHQLTRRQQFKIIGQRLLYTIGIVFLVWVLLFVSVLLMDFSIT